MLDFKKLDTREIFATDRVEFKLFLPDGLLMELDFDKKAFSLSLDYDWTIVKENDKTYLIPTKK